MKFADRVFREILAVKQDIQTVDGNEIASDSIEDGQERFQPATSPSSRAGSGPSETPLPDVFDPSSSNGTTGGVTSPKTEHSQESECPRHVFFVVASGFNPGDPHWLAQTAVQSLSTAEFFQWLRKEYLNLRGFFYARFGLSVFSHCEFYKVRIVSRFSSSTQIVTFCFTRDLSTSSEISCHLDVGACNSFLYPNLHSRQPPVLCRGPT